MSWFKPKASQEDFDYLVKKIQTQNTEIIRLEGKVQDLDTALSRIRIKVTELENSNNLLGSLTNLQVGMPPQHCTEHSEVTQHYSDSSPDLSLVMRIPALASDIGPRYSYSSINSCNSYSSSSSSDSSPDLSTVMLISALASGSEPSLSSSCDSYSSSSSDSYSSSSSDSSSSCGGE